MKQGLCHPRLDMTTEWPQGYDPITPPFKSTYPSP